jgi:hypothetical protein
MVNYRKLWVSLGYNSKIIVKRNIFKKYTLGVADDYESKYKRAIFARV